MNTFLAPFFLFSFLASTAFAQTFTINSLANVVQCQPSLITWTGGVSPYFLSILPAGQPSAAPILDFGRQTGTSFSWAAVNLTAGTNGFLQLRDSTGATAQSGSFTVLTSSDSSCIKSSSAGAPSTSTSAGASVPVGTTAPASGTTSHAASSASGTTTGGTSKTSASTSTSTGATQPKSSSAATAYYAPAGSLAMIGAAAVALVL